MTVRFTVIIIEYLPNNNYSENIVHKDACKYKRIDNEMSNLIHVLDCPK